MYYIFFGIYTYNSIDLHTYICTLVHALLTDKLYQTPEKKEMISRQPTLLKSKNAQFHININKTLNNIIAKSSVGKQN